MDNTMNEDNIDDVLSVIQGLPEFSSIVNNQNNQQEINVDNMEVPSSTGTDGLIASQIPYVIITEQPASKALRFRYRCEGRSAGSILGVNSTPSNKTYPTIKVIGYNGPAVVIVSCVTKDDYDGKYKTHPHNLVGMHSGNQNSCDKGVCIVYFSSDNNMEVSFPNLGIQCMKRRDIEDELTLRQSIQVDPFGAGFDHKHQPTTIDLNVVRLCFHVYIQKNGKGRYKIPLEPIVSDPIYGKKAFSDLVICELSHCSASAAGGSSMILLCEKVAKEDIKVRFFEEKNGEIMWEGYGEFLPTSVHKQVAISFKTPKYDLKLGENPVNVFIQLLRPSDGATSKPINFMMIPVGAGRPPFWSLRKSMKDDPDLFRKINNEPQKNSDNFIDKKYINNENIPSTNGKIAALRAFNNLYKEKQLASRQQNSNIINPNNFTPNFIPKNISINNSKIDILNDNKSPTSSNITVSLNQEINNEPIILTNNSINIREYPSDIINGDKSWFDYSEVGKWVEKNQQLAEKDRLDDLKIEESEPKLNELLNQVAEIDQIYEDTHSKILESKQNDIKNNQIMEIDVRDNQTYTSLQLAMKNPIELFNKVEEKEEDEEEEDRKYEDVVTIPPPLPPPLAAKRNKSRINDEKLPPLPPKRSRKMTSMPVLPRTSSCSAVNETIAPNKNLPLLPGTMWKPKQGLFSKLFSKKSKKYIETPTTTESISTSRNSISTLRNSLQDFSGYSSMPRSNINKSNINRSSITRSSMTSVAPSRSYDIQGNDSPPYGFDLTEAEHYALYTAMAPHATTSEFDEMSFYYSPVEGGKILSDGKET